MLISGIVVTASLVGVLVLLLAGGIVLGMVDKSVDKQRQH